MFKREMKINFKSFIIWLSILVGMFFVVFLIYPSIINSSNMNMLDEIKQSSSGIHEVTKFNDMIHKLDEENQMRVKKAVSQTSKNMVLSNDMFSFLTQLKNIFIYLKEDHQR